MEHRSQARLGAHFPMLTMSFCASTFLADLSAYRRLRRRAPIGLGCRLTCLFVNGKQVAQPATPKVTFALRGNAWGILEGRFSSEHEKRAARSAPIMARWFGD